MSRQNAKTMLFVLGIIEVIAGGISAIVALLAIVGGAALGALDSSIGAAFGIIAVVAGLVALVSAVFTIIIGIFGIKCKKDDSKAKTCFTLGLIVLALGVITLITNIASGTFGFGNITALILPGLYTYAAYILKKPE